MRVHNEVNHNEKTKETLQSNVILELSKGTPIMDMHATLGVYPETTIVALYE